MEKQLVIINLKNEMASLLYQSRLHLKDRQHLGENICNYGQGWTCTVLDQEGCILGNSLRCLWFYREGVFKSDYYLTEIAVSI
jgi:hypothetical protein